MHARNTIGAENFQKALRPGVWMQHRTCDDRLCPGKLEDRNAIVGEPVAAGTRLCTLHINDDAKGAKAEAFIREAIKFTPAAPKQEPLIQDLIS